MGFDGGVWLYEKGMDLFRHWMRAGNCRNVLFWYLRQFLQRHGLRKRLPIGYGNVSLHSGRYLHRHYCFKSYLQEKRGQFRRKRQVSPFRFIAHLQRRVWIRADRKTECRRDTAVNKKKKRKRKSNWTPPRNYTDFFSPEADQEFKRKHPIGYPALVMLGMSWKKSEISILHVINL